MELVYLWVEDYKNIHKQGFNFSPRFRCDYDEDTRELKVVDKEETGEFYPKNFFGDKINVTAIVGENGSGKTNLTKGLIEDFRYIIDISNYDKRKDNFFFIIFFDDKEKKWFKYDNEINEEIKLIFNKIELQLEVYTPTIIMYSGSKIMFDKSTSDRRESLNKNQLLYISDYFKLEEASNFISDKVEYRIDSFTDITYVKRSFTIKEILNFIYSNKNNLDNLLPKNFKIPEYINIYYSFAFIRNIYYNKIDDKVKIEDKKQNYKKIFSYNLGGSPFEEVDKRCFLALMIISVLDGDKEAERQKIEDILSDKLFLDTKIEEHICNLFEKFKNFEFFKGFYQFNELYDELKNKVKIVEKFEKLEEFINKYTEFIRKTNLDFLSFDFSPYLSSGEEQIIELISSIDYRYNKIDDKTFVLLILDEGDIFLHPNWNKELINIFLKYLRKFENVHLIITSHSPFILSDLPKENIIFLEKGKQVYPFEDGKQTFGANIHTLLSHGFFMNGGLMGEFAKSKIDDVINYLNNDKKCTITKDEDAQNIIDIIGEPIIKRELQRMLKNKMELSNKTEIDTIKNEIKLLTERLEKLEPKDEK